MYSYIRLILSSKLKCEIMKMQGQKRKLLSLRGKHFSYCFKREFWPQYVSRELLKQTEMVGKY